jgi:hypothetical protein
MAAEFPGPAFRAAAQSRWQAATGPLATRWTKEVTPENAHREYPRPTMARSAWLNLNGLWDYAIVERGAPQPAEWTGKILAPFPVESALSGVMKPVNDKQRLWYRRQFTVPSDWQGKRVLLHFGAVDWETVVWVNGKELGTHRGGYDGFSFDLTSALHLSGDQELVVAVWDPTDAGRQPRGKQVRNPHGIWYTPTTGIWQTVWLEPVPETHIRGLKLVPDLDNRALNLTVDTGGPESGLIVQAVALSEGTEVSRATGRAGEQIVLAVPNTRRWSPTAPFLYDLKVTLVKGGQEADQVSSYFGMRKIALAKDEHGRLRLFLNNQPLFQLGPLDQGFWPDGLYTAPTDAALRYDIEATRQLGLNLCRKHVKIEPERWYYWCDKLGLLVWQDMPSGGAGDNRTDRRRSDEAAQQFEAELTALVQGRFNHPSIIMWVPYNEGWGQYDTPRMVDLVRQLDPSRLVNNASGWTDRGAGDVLDIHSYPGPAAPNPDPKRASVLGEFGGLGLPLPGHTWQNEKNWGYRSFQTREELTDAYLKLIDRLHPLTGNAGLAAAVYTQTTDVEVEVNGLMTYDRALVKMDAALVTEANRKVYTPPPPRGRGGAFIPPATPLVAGDPYFSIWSHADRLTDDTTRHWTRREHSLAGLVRIDGQPFRVIGPDPRRIPALPQVALTVLPTRTLYEFEGAGVRLLLTFMNAALPDDLDLLSRPVTYLTWEVRSVDGQEHAVSLYFDSAAEIVVTEPQQAVVWSEEEIADLVALKFGSEEQPILAKRGDDLRIDWGYLYTAAPKTSIAQRIIAPHSQCRNGFAASGALPPTSDTRQPRPANQEMPVAAFVFDLGKVGPKPSARWLLLAYDDLYSIQYFKQNLRPYWRHRCADAPALLKLAARDYESLRRRCAAFDEELMADLRQVGGEKYAQMCALAYRQCLAGNKLAADANGQPLLFPKENTSNGCIGTVDVIYPMAPQFLLFGASLTKAMLAPVLDYASSPRWNFPFAPHDLGTYPKANAQVYGGGERTEENQMPVEETGNMLILVAALAQMEGTPKFAGQYWPVLRKWAEYLKAKGFDPEHQLCTDDFAGHLAHNVNLSAKAIVALGAFAKLCDLRDDKALAGEYWKLAREFAARWVKEADDGEHFRLAFDRPGTWSQKYNLVWDRLLGLNLFLPEVLRKEMDFYKRTVDRYGLALDNRQPYAKIDWTVWTATLTGDRADFEALLTPAYEYLRDTPDRVPVNDLYWTRTGREVGMHARPVVGAFFIKLLQEPAVWKKWARRDRTKAAKWAPFPKPPLLKEVIPTSEKEAQLWRYTTQRPAGEWFKPDFDAASWKEGPGGFGTQGTPGAVVRTQWNGSDIWLRREFSLSDAKRGRLSFFLHHDEDAEVYLNGVLAARVTGYTTSYEETPISAPAQAALRVGTNLIAAHCRQTGGGQYIDVGLVEIVETPAQKSAAR